MDSEPEEPGDEVGPAPIPGVVKAGCYALAALSAVSLLLSLPALVDASSARCTLARTLIDDANDDDEEFNDVDTGGEEPGDLQCDQAIGLAETIPVDENEPETRAVPSESAIRARTGISLVLSLGAAAAAILCLRTMQRRARNAALAFAGVSVLVPVLGLISLGALAFVVYALFFSSASREVWPRPERKPRSPET
ncbi:MAG: hypothetical protein ACRDY7_10310 [Acidimicrobiia bacterium]